MKTPEREVPETVPRAASRIIRRFGGRHLIYRTRIGGWTVIPHSYLLISPIKGPVWIFYGIGQIWLTHRKSGRVGGWIVRSPRIASRILLGMVERLHPELEQFIAYCDEHGVEGTIVMERRVIEFHWIFGEELPDERDKPEQSRGLHVAFARLVEAFERAAPSGD